MSSARPFTNRSRLRRSLSMVPLCVVPLCVGLLTAAPPSLGLAPVAQAAPDETKAPAGDDANVVTRIDGARIDWTARVVRVTGVGTPRVLSPTGAITEDDPYEAARADAEARLNRALGGIPVDGGRRLRAMGRLTDARRAAARRYTSARTLHFSDGTVHLPAAAGFEWVPTEWPLEAPSTPAEHAQGATGREAPAAGQGAPAAVDPAGAETPTGLVIELDAAVEPALRLELSGPDGQTLMAGVRGDRLGARGVVWVRRADDPRAVAWAGERPLVVKGAPAKVGRPGAILVGGGAAALTGAPVSAIVVVSPAEDK